jgi:ATP-dependent helicase/nuclease subunit B
MSNSLMSDTSPTLAEVCRGRLLDTKWLLAPSLRIGHQWIESLVRSGHSIVNLHPMTVSRIALEVVRSELAVQGLTVVARSIANMIVEATWSELPRDGYLGRLAQSAELSAVVSESLLSLRLVGVDADQLDEEQFETERKARDLRVLLDAYQNFLKSHSLVDEADVLRRAAQTLRDRADAIGAKTRILVPEGFRAGGLEKQFLDSLSEDCRIGIQMPSRQVQRDTTESTLPTDNQSVEFFRAAGSANEIREVLRRCLSKGRALDDVEILHSDTMTYVPLIHSLAHRYSTKNGRPVPVTFADGLPASLSRPGRALSGWLSWIREGYPQRLLVDLIGDGLLECGHGKELSTRFLVRLLRPLAIGLGADNYLPKLAEATQAKLELTKLPDDDAAASKVAFREKKQSGYRVLKKLVKQLLALSSQVMDGSPKSTMTAAEQFLTKLARSTGELDQKARQTLLAAVQERRLWLQRLDVSPDPVGWLQALPGQTRVMNSGPQPGHLHVAHVGSGGYSGRTTTFVVGLDDHRFPGAALQDPILLDHERQRLHAELPTSASRLHQKIDDLKSTLGRLDGSVTLSWSCHDLVDDREIFPSSVILAAWRSISGNQDADQESLNNASGRPVSFAPDDGAKALDESERWLWQLSDEPLLGTDQTDRVEARYAHLGRGSNAVRQRLSSFGPFSGYVPAAGADLNPFDANGPVLSASALETAGRCPLAFFFRNVLKVHPPDELQVDFDRWLDAAQFGSLMHDVFRQFMEELSRANLVPDYSRDHTRLAAILQTVVEQWRHDIPPPNENAFRTQFWQLARTARIFLQDEETFCRTSQPRFFEVAIGLKGVGDGTPLDQSEPASIVLSSGDSLRIRGMVDRVDETGPARYSVWDYKIGSGYGYDTTKPFRNGRRVQSVLYLKMIDDALSTHPEISGRVDRFGYFFPSIRAHGKRIEWPAEALTGGDRILQSLCGTIEAGEFPATDDKNDCTFCDYATICRDVERVTRASGDTLNRQQATRQHATEQHATESGSELIPLTHFRELRRG